SCLSMYLSTRLFFTINSITNDIYTLSLHDALPISIFEDRGVYVRQLPGTERGQVDLDAWKEWLSQQEFNEIHVEAGGRLNGAFVQAGLVDQVVAYMAPAYLMHGQPAVIGQPPIQLSQAWRLNLIHTQKVGPDVELVLRNEERWQGLLTQLLQQAE